MAQWIGCWTHDQKVWGSIPNAGLCIEESDKFRIPHCLGPPSCNVYPVHSSKIGSIVAGCIGAHLARRMLKYVEYALSRSLDAKQLPLTLLFTFH